MVSIGNSWDEILKDEFSGENYLKIREFLKDEYSHHVCYPSMYDIFNALKYTDYYAVKAVIIGQDPYQGLTRLMREKTVLMAEVFAIVPVSAFPVFRSPPSLFRPFGRHP